jgi:alkylation response protein AidB-like acyl-CoA dehydrogenase
MPASIHQNSDDVPAADVMASAMALSTWINERAEAASATATLPGDLVDALETHGFFRMALPRNLGGLELDPVTMLLTAEKLGWADGSTAWTVMIGNSSIAFAWLDQDVAATLLDGRSGQPLASMFAPTGRAVEVDGGYRLSGRWNYVTGSPHATMIVLGFIVVKPEIGAQTTVVDPMIRWGVVSAADVTIEATWRGAAGMCGSGSHDLTAKDVFVPTEHTLTPFIEDPRVEGPLYRTPFFKGTPLLTGVPLGVARRALDEINTLCRNKCREDAAVVEDTDVQIRLAQAEAALRASRSFVLDSLERLWADVQAGEPSLERETEFALAAQNAMRSAVHAVNLAFEIAGVSASKTGSVIQRCWRDVNVMSQHVAYSRARWREAGQALLGQVTNFPHF